MHGDTSASFSRPGRAAFAALAARTLRSDVAWLAACALAIAACLQLAAVAATWYLEPERSGAAHMPVAGIEAAGDELLYRACVREARLKSLPVKPYPQESERVSFLHEGRRLLMKTETLQADIHDMSVDNGCEVELQRHVRIEAAPSSSFSAGMRRMAAGQRQERQDRLSLSVETDAARHEPPCAPHRRMAHQGNYRLLSLCIVERAAQRDQAYGERKKNMRAIRRPTT
jgi:hypothetical protein